MTNFSGLTFTLTKEGKIMSSYINIRCRFLYENDKAIKVFSDAFQKELYIPKVVIQNYSNGIYRRSDVIDLPILSCVAVRKGVHPKVSVYVPQKPDKFMTYENL